jgi:hypothetical protein
VQKLPASSLAGLPDWLVVDEVRGIQLVEAKRMLEGGHTGYRPSQLTRAQRFFLNAVAQHGGDASVVVLGEEGYAEMPWRYAVKPQTRRWLELRMEAY